MHFLNCHRHTERYYYASIFVFEGIYSNEALLYSLLSTLYLKGIYRRQAKHNAKGAGD